MKLFVLLSLLATLLFACFTYRPVRVCEQVGVQSRIVCNNGYCVQETGRPIVVCHEHR